MFGIGFTEFITLILICLIFLRPDDFPKLVRQLGRYYQKWKQITHAIANDIQAISDWEDKKETPNPLPQSEARPSKKADRK